jgi:hypothetical protein
MILLTVHLLSCHIHCKFFLPESMISRSEISSRSNGSIISRWTTLLRSKTDESRTDAPDQITPPSGTEPDAPPASSQRTRTVYSAETPSAIAKSWKDLVVQIIQQSLGPHIPPSGYEVSCCRRVPYEKNC